MAAIAKQYPMTSKISDRKAIPGIKRQGRAKPRTTTDGTPKPDIGGRMQKQTGQARHCMLTANAPNPVVQTERTSIADMQSLLRGDEASARQRAARLVLAIDLHCRTFTGAPQCVRKLLGAKQALAAALRPAPPTPACTVPFALKQAEAALKWVTLYLDFDWEANASPHLDPREPRSTTASEGFRRSLERRNLQTINFALLSRKPYKDPTLEIIHRTCHDLASRAIDKALSFESAILTTEPVLDGLRGALSDIREQTDQVGDRGGRAIDLLDKLLEDLVAAATEPDTDAREKDVSNKLHELLCALDQIAAQQPSKGPSALDRLASFSPFKRRGRG